MLTPSNLLDIVRHFTLFTEANGRRIKIVARYSSAAPPPGRCIGSGLAKRAPRTVRATAVVV